jgi:hypothetical protein
MYVVPGSRGVCIALQNGSTCGDPSSTGHLGALLVDRASGIVTGAGIVNSSVTAVSVTVDDTSAILPAVAGTYIVTASDGLRAKLPEPPHISVSTID